MRRIRVPCAMLMIVLWAVLVRPNPGNGEPPAEAPPAPEPTNTTAEDFKDNMIRAEVAAPPDLGPPLVEKAEALTRLDPRYPVWIDKQGRQVVLVGAVCKRFGPLELFACLVGTKEYESIVSVYTTATVVQAALLAVGAEPGSPVQYEPEYAPPRGTPVAITVVWKDAEGRLQSMRAQQWLRNAETKREMEEDWVFAGGAFWRAEQGEGEIFIPNTTGDLICVANFPDAVLDVPTRSTTADVALLFEAYAERIPERGTPVTLILKPRVEAKPE